MSSRASLSLEGNAHNQSIHKTKRNKKHIIIIFKKSRIENNMIVDIEHLILRKEGMLS